MPKPKSFLKSLTIDTALRAHNCQHSKKHRIFKNDVRLGVKVGRNTEYYCKECAIAFLVKSRDQAISLIEQLQASDQKDAET